ncbi:glycosyltransferase family 4 protein [Thermodesulfobacteriota bacterium]
MHCKNQIRILRVIARLNIGGPALHAISLSSKISKNLYRTLLVCGNVSPGEGDMSYLAKDEGIEPYLIPKLGREISVIDDFKSFKELRRIIKRFRPDIIHTHTAKAGTLGRLAGISFNLFRGQKNRIKLVHTFHGHIFHSYFGALKTLFFIQAERFLARLTDRIIVISSRQRRDICQRFRITGPERVREILLGFDLSRFAKASNDGSMFRSKYLPQAENNVMVVGIIGRLTRVKNHRMFLETVKYLKDSGKIDLFRFLIVGDGELKEELIKYSRELAIQDFITFIDWQKNMPSVYKAMDIVALTSLNEGTPVTLIEAMAAGIPVVATDVGGVRDILGVANGKIDGFERTQNGILIPSGNSEVLAKALLYLHEDKENPKKMAGHAKEFALKKFPMERLVKDMESLYSDLV